MDLSDDDTDFSTTYVSSNTNNFEHWNGGTVDWLMMHAREAGRTGHMGACGLNREQEHYYTLYRMGKFWVM